MNIESRVRLNGESICTVALFAFGILALALISISNCFDLNDSVAKSENRMKSSLPRLSLSSSALLSFPNAFNSFYNDRFACRQELVSIVNYINYKACGVSGNSSVVVGRQGWLFFLGAGDEDTSRHDPLFSENQIQAWAQMLESRRAWLASKKIRFLFVLAPSKCSIYTEDLPVAYRPIQPRSRLDQLVDYLKTNSQVNFIDLRQPLIEAKKFAPIYYKTDSHWNPLGAYIAYSKIAERLETMLPQLHPFGFSDIHIGSFKFDNGDLQNMMGLHGLIPETAPEVFTKQHTSYETCEIDSKGESEVTRSPNAPYATEMADKRLPRAFCLRDSFMGPIEPFLSMHFARIPYYWQQEFPCTIIEREKPDVVIEEMVERDLQWRSPENPATVKEVLKNSSLAHHAENHRIAGLAVKDEFH